VAVAVLSRPRYRQPVSPARRAGALGLALALVTLLILALLRLGVAPPRPPGGRSLSTFSVLPEGERQAAARPQRPARRRAARPEPAPAQPAPPPALPPPLVPPQPIPGMILLTRAEMTAADIARVPKASGDRLAQADAGATATAPGAGEGNSDAVGTAPNGERLYAAQWYRKPPRNVLALYLSTSVPAGAWATIACRTIDRYQVDSCVQLDESPKGLGLSRALRSAAWQFRVLPPRLGGKPLIGAWVRILFTFEAAPDGASRRS
jgi:hypothetical protein